MSSLDQEVEATRKLSQELAEKSERLAKEALDPGKQLAPLFAAFDKEAERLVALRGEAAGQLQASVGCLAAAAEVGADWAMMEVMVVADEADGKPAAPAGGRAAPRRGMRI